MQPDATGADLRRRREALRISQRGIGERAGLDAATVRRVERDAGSVRSSSVGLYLRALEDAEAAMTGRVGSPATNPSSGKPQEKPPVSITVSGPDGLSVTVSGAIEHLDVLGDSAMRLLGVLRETGNGTGEAGPDPEGPAAPAAAD